MRVLIGCEVSGKVRRAFAARGHFAVSVDLEPADDGVSNIGSGDYSRIAREGAHYQGDIFDFIYGDAIGLTATGFDLFIAFYDCTYLTVSGLHWNNRGRGWSKTERAIKDVQRLMAAPIKRKVFENPIGILSTRIRKPDQIIQPFQFGHDASKATCLWLENVPKLRPTKFVEPRLICADCGARNPYNAAFKLGCSACGAEAGRLRPRWANQTDSGQNKLAPSPERAKNRSETYQGIADAFADQLG